MRLNFLSHDSTDENKVSYRYDAFISYSHAADGTLSPALQRLIERIAKPWYRLRVSQVYLDQTDLGANPDAWNSIETALLKSRFLIYLASPEAAKSKWVKKELGIWLEKRGPDSLLIGLTDGEVAWFPETSLGDKTLEEVDTHDAPLVDWSKTTALPKLLGSVPEPLWVDLREARHAEDFSRSNPDFFKAAAGLTSRVRGLELRKLISRDYTEHRRTIAAAIATSIVLIALFITSLIFLYQKDFAQQAAQRQADLFQASNIELRSKEHEKELETLEAGVLFLSELLQSGRDIPPQAVRTTARLLAHNRASFALQEEVEQDANDMEKQPVAAFSPSGKRLFVGFPSGKTEIWDPVARTLLKKFNQEGCEPTTLHWVNELSLVVGCSDGKARWFSAKTWQMEAEQTLHKGPITQLKSYKEAFLASLSERVIYDVGGTPDDTGDGTVVVVALPTWKIVRNESFQRSALALDFSPDGLTIAVGTDSGTIRFVPVNPNKEAQELTAHGYRHRGSAVYDVAYFANGNLVSTGEDYVARIWKTDDMTNPIEITHESSRGIYDVDISPDGSMIATGDAAGAIRILNATSGAEIARMQLSGQIYSVKFNHNGTELVSSTRWGNTQIWEIPSGEEKEKFTTSQDVFGTSFSHRGDLLLRVSAGEVRVNTLSGRRTRRANSSGRTHAILEAQEVLSTARVIELIGEAESRNPTSVINSRGEHALIRDHGTWQLIDLLKRESTPVPIAAHLSPTFSADGESYFVLDTNNCLSVFSVAQSLQKTVFEPVCQEVPTRIKNATFIGNHTEEEKLIIFAETGPAAIWDLDSGQVNGKFHGPAYLSHEVVPTREWEQDFLSIDREQRAWHFGGVGRISDARHLSNSATSVTSLTDNGGSVVGTSEGALKLFDHMGRFESSVPNAHSGVIEHLSAGNGRVVSRGSDRKCHFWVASDTNPSTLKRVSTYPNCVSIHIGKRGQFLALVKDDAGGKILIPQQHGNPVATDLPVGTTLIASSDDDSVLLTSTPTQLLITDLKNPERSWKHKFAEETTISAGAVSAQKQIAIWSDQRQRIWFGSIQQELRFSVLASMPSPIRNLQLSSDGTMLLVVMETDVQLLSIFSPNVAHTFPDLSGLFEAEDFWPDDSGKIAIISYKNSPARIWRRASRRIERTLSSVSDGLTSVTFSSGGTRVAALASDGIIRVWRTDTGSVEQELKPLKGASFNSVSWSAHGDLLVTAESSPREGRDAIRVWDAQTARQLHELPWPVQGYGFPKIVRLAQEGRLVLAGGRGDATDGPMVAWELLSERQVGFSNMHQETINDLALSPNGHFVASASNDGTVKVWDLKMLELLMTLEGDGGLMKEIKWSPDGSFLIVTTSDGRALLLPGSIRSLIALAAQDIRDQNEAAFMRIQPTISTFQKEYDLIGQYRGAAISQ